MQINNIRDKKGNITTDTSEIQMVIKEYSFKMYIPIDWRVYKKWIKLIQGSQYYTDTKIG
jgi:hypothetical protein